jgi:hypothetical protein
MNELASTFLGHSDFGILSSFVIRLPRRSALAKAGHSSFSQFVISP